MSIGINLKGIDAYEHTNEQCNKCIASQMKAKPFPLRQPLKRKATKPFEIIYIDLLTRLKDALDSYYKYLLVIVDDYTRYSWVYRLKSKHIDYV
jgi:hypothetical protein